MSFREEIRHTFKGNAFKQPLFYSYPGGLRFELSEGGSNLDMFMTALRKAREICEEVFDGSSTITVVLSAYVCGNAFGYRGSLRELKNTGVEIPAKRSLWMEPQPKDDLLDEETYRGFLAFEISTAKLENLLWSAVGSDLGIKPNPRCTIYLVNLKDGLLAYPYDDRGMDLVGPNHARLAAMYTKFRHYLLEYDIASMAETFEGGEI